MAGSSEPVVTVLSPESCVSSWIVPMRSTTTQATPGSALLASVTWAPGVGGPFELHMMSLWQPGRSPLLLFARTSMPDKLKKQGRQMATGKSEGRIVPMKPGNSGGGKAAERTSQVGQGIARTQWRTRGDNRTDLQNAAPCCGNVAVGSRMR